MKRLTVLLVAITLALTGATTAAPTAVMGSPAPTALDGMRLGHLPTGLGTSSDFAHGYDDVRFRSRVWESRAGDGWRVDLVVDVLRGTPLATAAAMHDWVIAYQERPPAEARYRRVAVNGRPGWRSADEVFWLMRPGVAVLVRLDTDRWSQRELTATARAVTPAVRTIS